MKDDLSFTLMFSVPLEIWNYPSVKKAKVIFSRKIHDDVSGITKKDDIHPKKDDIGILDWHSRKSSIDSLYFYGNPLKCFHILLSNEKKQQNNLIYRIETWLYL